LSTLEAARSADHQGRPLDKALSAHHRCRAEETAEALRQWEAIFRDVGGYSDFNALHAGKHNDGAELIAFDIFSRRSAPG
jgi:hypothetical protein